jgi:outer membrane receptor protein involved in Fe transport
VFTRYSFSEGRLKGFSVGGGYKHQSKMLIGKNSLDELQYGNSYWLVDMMLGYRFPRNGLLKNWNVQLNVSNVFDEDRPKVSRLTPEVPIPRIKYQTLQDPRQWRLTTNFEF